MRLLMNFLALTGFGTIIWVMGTNPGIFTRLQVIAGAFKEDIHALTSNPSSTPLPEAGTTTVPAANGKTRSMSTEEIVETAKAASYSYFNNLRLRNYGAAYAQLAPGFIQDRSLTLDSYSAWWRNYSVSMGNIVSVSKQGNQVNISTVLRFTGPNAARLSGPTTIGLVWQNNGWKINYLTKTKY